MLITEEGNARQMTYVRWGGIGEYRREWQSGYGSRLVSARRLGLPKRAQETEVCHGHGHDSGSQRPSVSRPTAMRPQLSPSPPIPSPSSNPFALLFVYPRTANERVQ